MKHIRKFNELNEGIFGSSKKEIDDDVELTDAERKDLENDIINPGLFGPGKKYFNAAAKLDHQAALDKRKKQVKKIGKDDIRFGEKDPDNPSVEVLLQRCVKLKDKFPAKKDYYRGKIAGYRHVLDMKADGELYFDKKSYLDLVRQSGAEHFG